MSSFPITNTLHRPGSLFGRLELADNSHNSSIGGLHTIVGVPRQHRWIGATQDRTGRNLQGQLMSADRRDGSGLLWWLEGKDGHQYVLTSPVSGKPLTTYVDALERAPQIIRRGLANHLYDLPKPSLQAEPVRLNTSGAQAQSVRFGIGLRRSDMISAASAGGIIRTASNISTTREYFSITIERRALLNTIRYAEGTWRGGSDIGYRVMFGGNLTPSLDKHPNRTQYSPRYASTAAGAYQFLTPTWREAASNLGLRSFGPHEQDQAALHKVQQRGALGLFDKEGLTHRVLARLAPEWASLPKLDGSSYYRQPVKAHAELQSFYRSELARLRAMHDRPRTPTLDV